VQVPASPPIAEAKVRTQGGTTVPAGPIGHTNPKIAQAIQVATNAIGTPYVWGGAGPKGFDCSGLIEYAFEQAGIPTPGRLTTGTAIKLGRRVNFKGLRPGDWLVRHDAKQQHMVMYVGNGQVVAAPRTGELVQFQPAKNFMGAGWQARRYP
jgi:cell wall-associated NlpC family hydrolase